MQRKAKCPLYPQSRPGKRTRTGAVMQKTTLIGCAVLALWCLASVAQDKRAPSTPEERKRFVAVAREVEAEGGVLIGPTFAGGLRIVDNILKDPGGPM